MKNNYIVMSIENKDDLLNKMIKMGFKVIRNNVIIKNYDDNLKTYDDIRKITKLNHKFKFVKTMIKHRNDEINVIF